MTYYEVIRFNSEFELDDNMEVVDASISHQGTHGGGSNYALVAIPEDDANTEYKCGYETEGGECSRTVETEDEYCWQHNDDG